MNMIDIALSYIPQELFLVQVGITAILFLSIRDKYLIRPLYLIPVVLIVYQIIGNLNLFIYQFIAMWYRGVDPVEANALAFSGAILLIVVLLIKRNKIIIPANAVYFEPMSIQKWIMWSTAIGTIINVMNYASFGGIPIFQSNLSGLERFEVAERMLFPKMLVISSATLTLNIIYFLVFERMNTLNFVLMAANFIFAVGIGSRHLIMLPMIIAVIFYLYVKRPSNKVIVTLLLSMATFVFLISIFRGDGYTLDLEEGVFSFGGEYRDYILLRDYFGVTEYYYGTTITPVVTNVIPKQLFELIGLNKKDFSLYSAYIAQDIWGADTGIRVGIWGEFLLNFGDWGIIIGFIVYGFIVSFTDISLLRNSRHFPNLLLLSFMYVMVIFSIIGSWATIGDTIQGYGLFYFLFYKFAGRTDVLPQGIERLSV